MRTRPYVSPTQLKKWRENKRGYYIEYLADTRVPKPPQTLPMAVGSAFDVFVKYAIARRFKLDDFLKIPEEEALLGQIENKGIIVQAEEEGRHLLECYKSSGAFNDLCGEIYSDIHMEFSVEKIMFGVPMFLKPDLTFRTPRGLPVVVDWKVNGALSASSTSPAKGYVLVRDGWDGTVMGQSRGNMTAHKECILNKYDTIYVNDVGTLTDEWELQIALYGLGTNSTVDEPMIAGIEQLACKRFKGRPYPRCASHRVLIRPEKLKSIRDELVEMWEVINSDHVFRDMSKADSQALQAALEKEAEKQNRHSDVASIIHRF